MKLPKNPLWPISPWTCFEGDADDPGTPAIPPIAIVDAEGNFAENWTQHLDEEIRDAECFKLVGNFKEMGKQFVEQRKAIGKDKVALPGENASDEELEIFYDQIGRPKTVEDYAYKKPEGVPDDNRSDERMAAIRKFAHENGWTQRQFNQYMKKEDTGVLDDIKQAEETVVRETEEAEKELKELWGMAYEERIHVVNRFINETTDEGEEREGFVKEFGRNPTFVKWAAKVGKKLVESDVLIAELTQKAPKEAQAELDEWHATEDYQKFLRGEFAQDNPAKHANMMRKEKELYDTIYPAQKAG